MKIRLIILPLILTFFYSVSCVKHQETGHVEIDTFFKNRSYAEIDYLDKAAIKDFVYSKIKGAESLEEVVEVLELNGNEKFEPIEFNISMSPAYETDSLVFILSNTKYARKTYSNYTFTIYFDTTKQLKVELIMGILQRI